MNPGLLFAQAADAATRVSYDWTRLQQFTEWWQKPLLILICLAVVALALYMYRRDSVELKPGVGWVLLILRLGAFAGLLIFFLGLEKRTEKQVTHNSRVVVLADTSLSMSRRDAGQPAGTGAATESRIEQVIHELAATDFLKTLRQTHDVVVYRFDQDVQRLRVLEKFPTGDAEAAVAAPLNWNEDAQPRRYIIYAGALIGAAALVAIFALRLSKGRFVAPWTYGSVAAAGIVAALVATASLNLTYPRESFSKLLGIPEKVAAKDDKSKENEPTDKAKPKPAATDTAADIQWDVDLSPRGTETRIGQALQHVLEQERSAPIAGVLIYTDGGQNAGVDPKRSIELAKDAKIALFPVGVGSDQKPINARISRMEAPPPRVFPGDGFKVVGYVQGEGLARRFVTVELRSRLPGRSAVDDPGQVVDSKQITLGQDGEEQAIQFDMPGTTEIGRRTYIVKVQPPAGDANPSDNQQESEVEIVERKNRVLLIAGGPTREYQFLRTQLKRDKDTIVHVLLQSGGEGISQDAHKILSDFPRSKDEMFEYDCVIGFDPNWEKLDAVQIDVLEKWVAEQAGGLIVIAGPIFTEQIAHLDSLKQLRGLYPVEFSRKVAFLKSSQFGSAKPSPLEFTRSGQEAEFLWLDETSTKNQDVWNRFPGVYGYFEVQGEKPGATILAYYSDPEAIGTKHLVYLAEQFFGAGRVFYMGSGEMWRLRSLEVGYFEQFYTKLIRHVSQGRLLRGSSRGALLVERERYLVGSSVSVRAQLLNAQLEPLASETVALRVIPPSGAMLPLVMKAAKERKGAFDAQFTALQEGNYVLELEVPESGGELLTKRIQVTVSDRELENPQRNGKLLKEFADATGGTYYAGVAATHSGDVPPLVSQIPDRTERSFLPGTRDNDWQRSWMTWLLVGICGVLCTEWMVRRLCKLA